MEKVFNFNWKIKEKPEYFLVKEVSEFEFDEKGQHFLYLLVKKNYNTKELAQKFHFNYAGLKDKNAITFQYVSTEKHIGNFIKEKHRDRFYILSYLGKIKRKIKIGNLKGNKFSIKIENPDIKPKKWMINYYDLQRIENNWEKGREILKNLKSNKNKTRKKLKWIENFYIDSYLSYLWNKSFEYYLMENFTGHFIQEKEFKFFIPETDYSYLMENVFKFWSISGYKVNMDREKEFYKKVLKNDFEFEEFIEILKNLRIKGDYRKTFVKVEDLNINGKYISFFLPKGSYGTMYLKHIFR